MHLYGLGFPPYFDLITLKVMGYNHLWTIKPEMTYYFCIPIFAFIAYKIQRFFIAWVSTIIVMVFCIYKYKIFGIECIFLNHPERENLFYSFPIFLNGSLL